MDLNCHLQYFIHHVQHLLVDDIIAADDLVMGTGGHGSGTL